MKIFRMFKVSVVGVAVLTVGACVLVSGCASFKPVMSAPHPHPTQAAPPPAPIVVDRTAFVFNNPLFDNGKSDLRPDAIASLDDVVAMMKRHPRARIRLTGHTSDLGSAEYNLALGLRRAEKAKAYLVEQGISADRLETRSAGETEPVVPNDSERNRAINRRVIFEMISGY